MPAIHPDPAVGTDPFGAAPDVTMSTSDGHRHVVGILAGDAMLRACVPNGIAGWELSGALDFQRTASLVAVHPPVSDVAMVSDPIEQLAAADVVIPPPVFMDACFDVRLHL